MQNTSNLSGRTSIKHRPGLVERRYSHRNCTNKHRRKKKKKRFITMEHWKTTGKKKRLGAVVIDQMTTSDAQKGLMSCAVRDLVNTPARSSSFLQGWENQEAQRQQKGVCARRGKLDGKPIRTHPNGERSNRSKKEQEMFFLRTAQRVAEVKSWTNKGAACRRSRRLHYQNTILEAWEPSCMHLRPRSSGFCVGTGKAIFFPISRTGEEEDAEHEAVN